MFELRYTPNHLERQRQAYITQMERAFGNVDLRSFAPKDQPAMPALSDIFVVPFITKLDMNSPTPQQAGTESLIPILPFLSDSHYAVLLGGPGMGKSTITRYLTWSHTVIKEAGEPLPPSSLLQGNP